MKASKKEYLDEIQKMKNRYRVYIIDEAHGLSRSAFNAMLKTMKKHHPYLKQRDLNWISLRNHSLYVYITNNL